jgi:hypothetical protein
LSFRSGAGSSILAGAVASAAVLACATVALAAHPAKGKTYSGSVKGNSTQPVSFKVNSRGTKVVKLMVPVAFGCQGGGVETPKPASAKITPKGTFRTTVPLTGVGGSTGSAGSETITGTFLKGHKEKGTITSHFKTITSCDTTLKYTTKAA